MKTTRDSQGLARDQPQLGLSIWAQAVWLWVFNMKFVSTLISSFEWLEAFLRFYGAQIPVS